MTQFEKSVGQQLRETRESVGKSQSDLAEATKIGPRQLMALEEDDYSKIPAPMYVRGFIKLYAQALGMAPEPLIEQYERGRKGGGSEGPAAAAAPADRVESPSPGKTTSPKDHLAPVRAFAERFVEALSQTAGTLKAKASSLRPGALKTIPRRLVAVTAGGLLLLILIGSGLRRCAAGSPETPEPAPGIERETLTRPPDPILFQLPRTDD